MSLGKKLSAGLQDLRMEGGGGGGHDGTAEAEEGQSRVRARVADFDTLAVSVDEIEVWNDTPRPSPAKIEHLMEVQARHVEANIGYLVERFRTVEFNREENVIQMRSVEPFTQAGERHYYELLLTDGRKAALRRYRGAEGRPGRESVHMVLTLDVLERLVDDLSAALRVAWS